MLVNFDMALLFTRVLVEDTLLLLLQHFSEQTLSLIRHVLTKTYFLYNHSFYNQRDCVTMGLSLTPVLANYHMEFFGQQAISWQLRHLVIWK